MPEILMPALSPTMEEGKLAKWLKNVGDDVHSGDVIAEIETDKATMEVEAVDEGKLSQILVPEGTEGVKVNTPIAVIAGDGESPEPVARTREEPAPARDRRPAATDGAAACRCCAAAHAPLPAAPAADLDVPEGTELVAMTVREALREAMAEEMRRDPSVFLIGEEVGQYQGAYKISQGLLDEFGDKRVVDTPITEYGFTGLAVGAAFAGLRPIVEFMTFNFSLQAIDHIINSAAKTLYMSGGQMGARSCSADPMARRPGWPPSTARISPPGTAQIPGLKVVQPYTRRRRQGPAQIGDPRSQPGDLSRERDSLRPAPSMCRRSTIGCVPIGKARIARPGSHVTIVSFGIAMTYALGAADKLAQEGIEAEVVDLRTMRPMDIATVVESVKKTNRCVTVEEGWPHLLGSARRSRPSS